MSVALIHYFPILVFAGAINACASAPPPSSSAAKPPPASPSAAPRSVAPSTEGAHVTVDRTQITLDGAKVGDASVVDAGGKMTRLTDLYDGLRSRRDRVTSQDAGAQQHDDLWLDATHASATAGASAVMTAAFAGYHGMHIRSGNEWVQVEIIVPSPPRKGAPDGPHARLDVHLSPSETSTAWTTDRECASTPESRIIGRADLASALDQDCATRENACVDEATISAGTDQPFADLASALAIVHRHSQKLRVLVSAFAPSPLRKNDRGCGKPLESRLQGRLPPAEIQGVVRVAMPRMRACYEQGLARDKNLTGRVVARFIIDRDGTVSSASSVDVRESGVLGGRFGPSLGPRARTKTGAAGSSD